MRLELVILKQYNFIVDIIKLPEDTSVIEEYLELYQNREYRETPIFNDILKIVENIASEYNSDPRQALMSIFYALMIHKVIYLNNHAYYNLGTRKSTTRILPF